MILDQKISLQTSVIGEDVTFNHAKTDYTFRVSFTGLSFRRDGQKVEVRGGIGLRKMIRTERTVWHWQTWLGRIFPKFAGRYHYKTAWVIGTENNGTYLISRGKIRRDNILDELVNAGLKDEIVLLDRLLHDVIGYAINQLDQLHRKASAQILGELYDASQAA